MVNCGFTYAFCCICYGIMKHFVTWFYTGKVSLKVINFALLFHQYLALRRKCHLSVSQPS